jgi:hypothetical protein
VTYHYLCDSVMVFDRRVSGETLEFGVSGLLLNSNLLLYDRRPHQQGESLWCQMTGRAISGPAAAAHRVLKPLPCRLLPWAVWFALTPDTSVMKPPGRYVLKKLYDMTPAPAYFGHDKLRFPVDPLPPHGAGWPTKKARVVAVRIDGRTVVYPLSRLEKQADRKGCVRLEQGGVPLTFEVQHGPNTVLVTPGKTAKRVEIYHACWFAWHAFHPGDPLYGS